MKLQLFAEPAGIETNKQSNRAKQNKTKNRNTIILSLRDCVQKYSISDFATGIPIESLIFFGWEQRNSFFFLSQ